MADETMLYPDYAAKIVRAYIDAVVARASNSPDYDEAAHAAALANFDAMLTRLCEVDELMDYLCDAASGIQDFTFSRSGDPGGVRSERNGMKSIRVWVNRSEEHEETVYDALREYARGNVVASVAPWLAARLPEGSPK